MAIQTEYERFVDIEKYSSSKKRMLLALDNVISILNDAVALQTKYPDDTIEINGDINYVKTRCQNIIDTF